MQPWPRKELLPAGVLCLVAVLLLGIGLILVPPAGAETGSDQISPASSIINPVDGTVTNTASYLLTGSATDIATGGSEIRQVEVTDAQGVWQPAVLDAPGVTVTWSYAWQAPALDDYVAYTVRSRAIDAANNTEVPLSSRTLYVDRVPPLVSAFAVQGNSAATASRAVTVSSAVADGSPAAAWQARYSVDGGSSWAAWEAYTATKNLTLPAGDGQKIVVAEFKDAGGNVTSASDAILYEASTISAASVTDTEAPTGAISQPADGEVLAGAAYTIQGTAADNWEVRVVEVSVNGGETWFAAAIDSGAGTTSASWHFDWTLPAEDADVPHLLRVRVTDGAGLSGTSTTNPTVRVDNIAPAVTKFVIANDAAYVSSTSVALDLALVDGTPPVEVQLSNDNVTWEAWQGYATSLPWSLTPGDGTKTVYARFRDAKGNTTTGVISDSALLDSSAPLVTANDPGDGEAGVGVTAEPEAAFSDPLDPATLTTTNIELWLDQNENGVLERSVDASVAGSVAYDQARKAVRFVPAAALTPNMRHFFFIGTGVRNAAGVNLAASWLIDFTTGSDGDTVRPTITAVDPAGGAAEVPLDTLPTITFSEPVSEASVTTDSISLLVGGSAVPGGVELDLENNSVVRFRPNRYLSVATEYTVRVTVKVKDRAGNALGSEYTSSFSTAANGINVHGRYTTTSALCRNCHSVHGAPVGGEFGGVLLTELFQTALCYTCHDGSGASTDVESIYASATSGHVLDDSTSMPGAGLADRCSSCHSAHFDSASRPKQPHLQINGKAVGGDNYSWCQACHDDPASWVATPYPYPAGSISSTKPQRAQDGYPVAGTFPGSTAYNDTTFNAHNPTSSTNVVWPESGRPSGDCRNCHAAHANNSPYDALVAPFRPTPDDATVLSDRQNGTYAELCLTCHDGSPSAKNIKQFVTHDYDKTGNDYTGGHRIVTAGGTLPAGAPLPCYDCHNPHGSKGNNGTQPNKRLISDEQWSGIDTSTTAGVVGFCTKCHLPWEYVAQSGQPEANTVPSGQLTQIEGLDRRVAANKLSLPSGISAHGKANLTTPTESCYECHGNSYDSPTESTGFNVHRPAPAGGCVACHSKVQDAGDGGPTRRAVTADFSAGGGHHVEGQVTDKDCGVCHLEGNAATGGVSAEVHRNNQVDLRNPDTGDGSGLPAFESFTRDTTSASLEPWVTDVQNNLCLKCHDVDGAASGASRTDTGTPQRPFSSGSTNAVDVSQQLDPANGFQHAVRAPGTNPNATPSAENGQVVTMVAPWNQSPDTHNVISCFDCHVSTAGHGGAYGKMARTDIGDPPSTPNYAGMLQLCRRCHRQSVYEGSGLGSGFSGHGYEDHTSDNALSCRGCHAGLADRSGLNGENGAPGSLHGGSFTWPATSRAQGPTQYFLYGGWLSGWEVDPNEGRKTCYGGDCHHNSGVQY